MNIQIFGTKKCNDTKKAEHCLRKMECHCKYIDISKKSIERCFFFYL